MKKQLINSFVAAVAAMSLFSCTKNQLTPSSWIKELSYDKVIVRADIDEMAQTKTSYTTTLENVQNNGFNMTALNATGELTWSEKMVWNGSAFSADSATWTKAGEMSFYAAYPTTLKFGANKKIIYTGNYQNIDALAGCTKSTKKESINVNLYHILSQINGKVINNSDMGIRVHADVKSYFTKGEFTWSEPVDVTLSDGTVCKKLPASCWNVGDLKTCDGFYGTSVGNTAGTVASPMTKGQEATLVQQNVVPVVFPDGAMRSSYSGDIETVGTCVLFTVYWKEDGIDQSYEYKAFLPELIPGITYNVILEVSGEVKPSAVVSTVAVDGWTPVNELKPVNSYNDFAASTIKVQPNDATFGYIQKSISGNTVTVQATANSGYKFIKWSDENTSAKRTFTTSETVNLTAFFDENWINSNIYASWADGSTGNFVKFTKDASTAFTSHLWKGTLEVTGETLSVVICNKPKPSQSGRSAWGLTSGASLTSPVTLVADGESLRFAPGKYEITFNEKTLELSFTGGSAASSELENAVSALAALIELYESDDPNDYDYTAESLAAYNSALAAAKAVLNSTDVDEVTAAKEALEAAYKGLTTGSTTAEIPDIS
ncbi:MAG: hypothetical protein Q4G10_06030 [Bacteroidia bacterium]|nr:hypothetical protein [Bacteroidia bacterium]